MRRFRIGSAFGIPIKLDLTFLLVLPLFAFVIAIQVETWTGMLNQFWTANIDPAPLSDPPVSWILGLTAALGLFAGIVLHELGHSLVAMRYGVAIDSITLWLFGGIAQLEEFPDEWQQELYVAIAGPIVSVALGVVSYGAFLLVPPSETLALEATRFLLGYLAVMNVALAVFNMLPGFPMDGGRVLRALLVRNRPYAQATKIAAEVGKVFAIFLGLAGVFVVFNPFLIALAFFIYIGASSEAQQTIMRAAFEGVVVADIMTPADRVETVDEDTSVATLVEKMLAYRHTGYPVERDGEIVGIVTLEDARAVRDVEQEAYTVGDVMSRDIHTVHPAADVMEALTEMQENSIGRLIVADEEFAGLLTRTDIMTALSIIKTSGQFDKPSTEAGETDGWQSQP
ncbi:CBS domain-containing protein [Salinibaculum salinum]|uniref:CBS domain-containing protein n=1 Tax=Salinibaculum salinum TaxID=3131996 RepID=UPI0030ED2C88